MGFVVGWMEMDQTGRAWNGSNVFYAVDVSFFWTNEKAVNIVDVIFVIINQSSLEKKQLKL